MVNENIGTLACIVLLGLVFLFLVFRASKYKKLLDEKNIQLIQFYLDTKFLCRSLIDSLNISDSSTFCSELLRKIKEYYNLEDIIIIDSIKMVSGENNTTLRNDVVKYIKDNIQQITSEMHDYKLVKFNFSAGKKAYEIYISRILSKDEGDDGLIVCVEYAPTLLSKQEKASLENSINLLKNRLLYG
ncbi:MAG: hypothetical protein Tsb006_6110 [Rickettsiaceae bacterium]